MRVVLANKTAVDVIVVKPIHMENQIEGRGNLQVKVPYRQKAGTMPQDTRMYFGVFPFPMGGAFDPVESMRRGFVSISLARSR